MTTTPLAHAGDFTFYATTEYFAQLRDDIEATKAGDRVLLATMAFDPNILVIGDVITALCKAADRGVTVHVFTDAYNFLLGDDRRLGPLWLSLIHI